MLKTCVFVALFFWRAVTLAQTTYYVDGAAGNNANAGTGAGTAWRTIQKACDAAAPNSTVLIRGGTYRENLVVNVSGAAGRPIVFKAVDGEQVLIDGAGTTGTTLLRVSNRSSLHFENLIFQNLTARDAQGILVETTGTGTSTDLAFKNLTIRRIRWTNNPATIPNSNNNAQGFVAYGRRGGITNLTLDGCEVSDNILGFSEALTLDGNVSGFVIQNCQVHDNTNIGIDLIGNFGVSPDPATDQARNGVVRGNACYRNVSRYATSAGIYVDGGKDIVIDGNRSYENGWGVEVGAEENGTVSNITVINNLVYNNQQAGLAFGGYNQATTGQVINSVVRNNAFFFNNSANDGTGEVVLSKASNCRLENNVFYTNAQNVLLTAETISPQTGNVLDYNCWYTPANTAGNLTVNWRGRTYNTFATYRTGTGQEDQSRYANPGLVSPVLPAPDLHLLTTSLCRDAGNPITAISPGETDFDGRPRVGGTRIDIGAFEFGSGPLPVELLRFVAERAGPGRARLAWATATETRNAGFAVQVSSDGRSFRRIGWVAGQGSSTRPAAYVFTDSSLAAHGPTIVYYRLHQLDIDSTGRYSPVRLVTVGISAADDTPVRRLSLIPNPAGAGGTRLANAPVWLLDGVGREVLRTRTDAAGQAILLPPAYLPPGVYVVRTATQSARLAVE